MRSRTLVLLRAAVAIVVVLGVAAWVWRTYVYPWKLHAIQRAVAGIGGVTISAYGGYSDLVMEEIWVELSLGNERKLRLWDLDAQSFLPNGRFSVQRIGPWTPAVNRAGVARVPDSLYFGAEGDWSLLEPLRIESVAQLVTNYDSIVKVIEGWPLCPQRETRADSLGEVTYCRRPYASPTQNGPTYAPPW